MSAAKEVLERKKKIAERKLASVARKIDKSRGGAALRQVEEQIARTEEQAEKLAQRRLELEHRRKELLEKAIFDPALQVEYEQLSKEIEQYARAIEVLDGLD